MILLFKGLITMPIVDYFVKVLFVALIISLVGSGFTRFIPNFSSVTCDQVYSELATLNQVTASESHLFVIYSENEPDKRQDTDLFTLKECKADPNYKLIKLRSVGVFEKIYMHALLLSLCAYILFSLKKNVDVSRHRSPHFFKFFSSAAITLLFSFNLFLVLQTQFNPILYLCLSQTALLVFIAVHLAYRLGFDCL